jgi:hypothetical protein
VFNLKIRDRLSKLDMEIIETLDIKKYAYCGMVSIEYRTFERKSGLDRDPFIVFKKIDVKKLRNVSTNLANCEKPFDYVKVNNAYFSGFRIAVLLKHLLIENSANVEFYQIGIDYPLAIKVGEKVAFLAPVILCDIKNQSDLLPSIESFGEKL